MLFDTDVLIWYLRGDQNAFEMIEKHHRFSISVVAYIEIVQGMRNKQELAEIRKAFDEWKTKIIFINEEISMKAMFFIEKYFLSHSFQLADALIASTALAYGLPIVTSDAKHFKVIKELEIIKFTPKINLIHS